VRPPTARGHPARPPAWRRVTCPRFFFVCLVLTFLNFAIWSVATPLFASPDEPTQVIRAAAAVRGELVGTTVGSAANATTRVRVPEVFASGPPYTACFAFHATVPASCAPPIDTSRRVVTTVTYAGRYPPLYYLAVGWPSLLTASTSGIYSMRLVAALLDALFVSLALLAAARWSRRRLLLLGVMVAVTPMVWFLGSVVNPSGFEICAALCLWTSGLVLVTEHAEDPPPGLVALVAVSLGALLLTRPLSPLWALLTVAVLVVVGGWRCAAALSASRAVRWSVPPLAACAAFALWWIEAEHSLDLLPVGAPIPPRSSSLHLVLIIAGRTGSWLREMVGVFGALDTNAPSLTYVIWAVLVVGAGLVALARAGPRRAGVLVALVACVLVIPVVVADSQAHRLGIVWQARDIMPLAVGVPVLSLWLVDDARVVARHRRAVAAVVCAAVGVGAVAAFLEALRRYTVGVSGPVDFLGGRWHPPLGTLAVAIGECVVVALVLAWVGVVAGRRPGAAVDRAAHARRSVADLPVSAR
jgi:hypothetical protein